MSKGVVKWFNEIKGSGFIAKEDGSDLFANYLAIVDDRFRTLTDDETAGFDVLNGDKGEKTLNIIRL